MGARTTIGRAGESTAAAFIQEHGLDIIERNWRNGRAGELDIIADDGDRVVVIEVKTRVGDRCGTALEAVDARKLARLRGLAVAWAKARSVHRRLRIDAIGISLDPQELRPVRDTVEETTDLRSHGARIQWVRGLA